MLNFILGQLSGLYDFTVTTEFDREWKDATLTVSVELTEHGNQIISYELIDPEGKPVFSEEKKANEPFSKYILFAVKMECRGA